MELQAKYNQTGGSFMLYIKKNIIIFQIKRKKTFDKTETKFVIKYKDFFLNQQIFRALNLTTVYFEGYSSKLDWSNPNMSELYKEMVDGVTSYLSTMSRMPVESGDLSINKDIYISDPELLKKFLTIQTSDKSFKLSGDKYIWDSNTVSK